jgi:hypothetical protein
MVIEIMNSTTIHATAQASISHALTILGLIFGGIILLFLIIFLAVKYQWKKKAKEKYIFTFKKTQAVRLLLLHPNKQITSEAVLMNADKTTKVNDLTYILNPETFFYKDGIAHDIRVVGNPHPVKIDFRSMEYKADTKTMKEVLEQKFVNDLLYSDTDKIMLIVIVVLCVLILLISMGNAFHVFDAMMKAKNATGK